MFFFQRNCLSSYGLFLLRGLQGLCNLFCLDPPRLFPGKFLPSSLSVIIYYFSRLYLHNSMPDASLAEWLYGFHRVRVTSSGDVADVQSSAALSEGDRALSLLYLVSECLVCHCHLFSRVGCQTSNYWAKARVPYSKPVGGNICMVETSSAYVFRAIISLSNTFLGTC